jgi:hypothetical protein
MYSHFAHTATQHIILTMMRSSSTLNGYAVVATVGTFDLTHRLHFIGIAQLLARHNAMDRCLATSALILGFIRS